MKKQIKKLDEILNGKATELFNKCLEKEIKEIKKREYHLKKLKKLSPEEIKEVEKLGVTVLREEDVLELEMLEKTASKYISEKDAEFLKKYVTAFKNKWENFQKENA